MKYRISSITKIKLLIISLVCCNSLNAQIISSKVLDKKTDKPIPYATIQTSVNTGTISNAEGKFTLILNDLINFNDSIYVSSIGYIKKSISINNNIDSIIYLEPKAIELDEVVISNKKYSADELINKVKVNIIKNYNLDYTKKRLFLRESKKQKFTKKNYTFVSSTIKGINKQLMGNIIKSIPNETNHYTEVLFDLYGNFNEEEQKINIIKACELYDKSSEVSFEAFKKKLIKIMNKNVKKDSYIKIKSGFFSTKASIDEIMGSTESLQSGAENNYEFERAFADDRKIMMKGLYKDLFFLEDSDLNFLEDSKNYNFNINHITYLEEDLVYVIDFVPDRQEYYKGTLYINSKDFAIVRVDYKNTRPLKTFRLLGVSFGLNVAKGKMIFQKGRNGRYNLKYLEKEIAVSFGIKRPLKVIEKNKNVSGRRKQNKLVMKLDMATRTNIRFELVAFNINEISMQDHYSYLEDPKILPIYMESYKPDFWDGFNIIEPNIVIKKFSASNENNF